MQLDSSQHFESAFDYFWQAQSALVKGQMELVVASMTVGIEFWSLWQHSQGNLAVTSVDVSHGGNHRVINAKFNRVR